MVNILEFTTRLKKVMEYHQLSASLFADKVGVQRSSISHILSGRNKPSLDFILKVTSQFNDVAIEWLLNGKGIFPTTEKLAARNSSTSAATLSEKKVSKDGKKEIQRILLFYTDGSFEELKKNF
jgi:transcriptional regulator with XRE-family HTH domain